ncbi:MAG: hypothetical protein GY910_19535 [bacterium]|nr:hypothetical protein [Deltaproteobacteria bacterium]MCP4907174.1 hypothetical protein [bacterium]
MKSLIRSTLPASMALLFMAVSISQAQTVSVQDDSRGENELRSELREAIDRDTDVANTALVFNNTTSGDAVVVCTAFGANGNFIGRGTVRLPARGVRYLRASDLSGGADFVGSALCASRVRVAASAIFLAPGSITNLDVIQAGPWDAHNIRFPLVASY